MLEGLIHPSDLVAGDEISVTLFDDGNFVDANGYWGGQVCSRKEPDEPGGFVVFLYDHNDLLKRCFFAINPMGPNEIIMQACGIGLRRKDP